MSYPARKHPRLKNFDYSQCGCYHVTICTQNRIPILSSVIPAKTETERAQIELTHIGRITQHYIQRITDVYTGIQPVKYVIMPNHVHLLLVLESNASVDVPTVVHSLKRMVTKEAGQPVWQRSFYDVVIRNDIMLQCEWTYIDNNPDKWAEDDLYV
jgi:REP element-mobilizing transposase RayT